MDGKFVKFFIISAVAIFLATGCAKKNKPDDNIAGIEARDMTFEATGSDSGKIDGLYTVHFDYDQSKLTEETRNSLLKDADWLRHHGDQSFQIEGHCDRHGSIEYNLALGQKRADSVMHYLLSLGINKDRLTTISYGKEKLLDTEETEAADVKNRRVNFKPIYTPKINSLSSR